MRAIADTITIWNDKNEMMTLISKRLVAKNLEIITTIIRQWINIKTEIEVMHIEVWKHRTNNQKCQKLMIKKRLMKLLKQKRKTERRISRDWFIRQTKKLYDEIYPYRVIQKIEKRTEFIDFKFSFEWIRNFKKRVEVSLRIITKKAQKMINQTFFI